MDYSLLLGIHSMDQACRDRGGGQPGDSGGSEGAVTPDQRRPQAQRSLYCTAMESIQGEARGKGALDSEDQWVVAVEFSAVWDSDVTVTCSGVVSVALFYQHGWYSSS